VCFPVDVVAVAGGGGGGGYGANDHCVA